jgi:hypothetical protein
VRLRARALVLAALGSLTVAAGAAAQTRGDPVAGLTEVVGGPARVISPGVEVFEITRTEPLLRARVARIAPDVVRDRLRLVVSNDAIAEADGPRRETVTSMCQRMRCVVGVNADQWYVEGSDLSTPVGGTVVDGELWRTPEPNPNPFVSMGQLQIDALGVPDAREAPAGWTATLSGPDGTTVPLGVNRIPLPGEVVLYTPRLGTRTPEVPGVQEWVVEIGPVREGTKTLRLVGGPTEGGGSDLPPGFGFVAALGPEAVADAGAILFEGTATVSVDLDGARWASGGFPVLFEDGNYTIFPDDPDNRTKRAARTIAGWTAAGELLLVTADRRPGWSEGLTVLESAQLLRTLGAVEAINLDGGGSTTFVEGGRVANRPSDGTDEPRERAVVDALVVVPPEGIDFATPVPRVPTAACPDGQVPGAPFDDLSGAATHAGAIACVAWRDITTGTSPKRYDPIGKVSRAQMATFLERLLVASGVAVPTDVPDAFTDDDTSVHEPAIDRLAAMGIVAGTGGGRYDPEGPVTRAQMGTFLARALGVATGGGVGPLAEHDYFVDDSLDVHQANINVIAEHGIASGVTDGVYNPGGQVSRAQMASFLVRTLDAAIAP